MKTIAAVSALSLFVGCSAPPPGKPSGHEEMPAGDVTRLLAEATSEWTGKAELGQEADQEYYFELTSEQFESLKHEYAIALKEFGQKNHNYDLFSDRGTVLNPLLSNFTFKMGIGNRFHYVIHGVRAELPGRQVNTVITISRTAEGQQDAPPEP